MSGCLTHADCWAECVSVYHTVIFVIAVVALWGVISTLRKVRKLESLCLYLLSKRH